MKTKISLARINNDLLFEASNSMGASARIGRGHRIEGMRPMEMLMSALASCSAFDLELILRKQRQKLEDLRIEVEGTRPDEGDPKPFDEIHMQFYLTGALDSEKVNRAVALSVEKYCSVGATLRKETRVSYSVHIIAPVV